MTNQDFTPRQEAQVNINYEEPETRQPPLLDVGALAWLRKNLFGSPLDVVLTLIGIIIIAFVTVTFISWSVQAADWMSIHLNLQRFMVDRLSNDYLWRVQFATLFIAFTIGVSVAAYSRRISPLTALAALAVILPVFVLPPIITATIPMPPTYLAAGNTGIASGTTEEVPFEQIAYIGSPGDSIEITLEDISSEQDLAYIDGFMDRATNTLRNAADNRLLDIARFDELTDAIIEDTLRRAAEAGSPSGIFGTLTDDQRLRYYDEYQRLLETVPEDSQERATEIFELLIDADELGDLEEEDPEQVEALTTELTDLRRPAGVTEVYDLNGQAVTLQILDASFEPLTDPFELTSDNAFTYTHDGDEAAWHILQKTIDSDSSSVALLAASGIQPIFQSSSGFRVLPEEQPVVTAELPEIDEEPVQYLALIRTQYRGDRDFTSYLRIYVAPFLTKLAPAVFQLVLAVLAGFILARLADRQFSTREAPAKQSQRMSNWLLFLTLVVFYFMVQGVPIVGEAIGLEPTDSRRWGGLLLAAFITFYGIIIAFPLGIALALGRRSDLPAISYLCTVIIETVRGTPYIVVLFAGQLLVPLLHPSFAEIPNVYRALGSTTIFIAAYLAENVRGGLQSIPDGQTEAARALGLSGWQTTVFITLPQALRAVIPALVGQFISLFKDTSLLAIVGLIDLTGVVNTMVAQAEFNDARREGLLFISIIYFAISYVMSYVSRRMEESGSGAARRI